MGGDPHIKNKPFYLAVRVNLLICARSPISYTTRLECTNKTTKEILVVRVRVELTTLALSAPRSAD